MWDNDLNHACREGYRCLEHAVNLPALTSLGARLLAAEKLAEVVEEFLSSVDRAAAVEGDWDRLTVPPVRAALLAWKEAGK